MLPNQLRGMANQMPDNAGKFDFEVAKCLNDAADTIERLNRELMVERAVNERLREIKSPPRQNYLLRAAVVLGALLVFSVAYPILMYVFNPGAGASW